MLVTTSFNVEGYKITNYIGIVSSEIIIGANAIKDIAAGLRDFFGGRSSAYENTIKKGREEAMQEITANALQLNADAIIGAQFSFNTVGAGGMLMITITGTAVKIQAE